MRNVVLIVEVNDECGLTDAGLFEYLRGELKASDANGDGYVKEIYELTVNLPGFRRETTGQQ